MTIGPSAFKKDEALNINPEEILEWGGRTSPCFGTYTSRDEITH